LKRLLQKKQNFILSNSYRLSFVDTYHNHLPMGGSRTPYRQIATKDGCVALFHMYCFDGAFVGGLLGGVLKFCRDFIDQDYRNTIAHRKDFRTRAYAKTARSAGIINSDLHKTSHNKYNINYKISNIGKMVK
jgi:hypothetical protein